MAMLTVRNLDDDLKRRLRLRAGRWSVILLDTNVVSEWMKVAPDPEVIAWLDRQRPGRCLAFDCAVAPHYASILARSKRLGRPVSVEDAQIAAIAYANNLELATRNRKDLSFWTIGPGRIPGSPRRADKHGVLIKNRKS